ncbi:MAG TPA: SRPBCC family protein [Candidatus Nitrosotalea sp.]|nr:SRPBCC family protein [Candidatus Nitrosotalea sp.]
MRGKPGSSWQIHVNASPERTFDYVAALESHPQWAMEQMTVAPEASGPATVGSRYQVEGAISNKRQRATVTVTELERPVRFAFESADESSITGHAFTFTPYGGGTLVAHQIFAIKQPLVGSLMLRVRRSAVEAGFNRQLSSMRSNVESAAGTSARPTSSTRAPSA